jgi:hypothetical protein
MNPPMVLPWLARRAGVSIGRAEALWPTACRQSAQITGQRDGSSYWGTAVQTLLHLLQEERRQTVSLLTWPWLLLQSGVEHWSRLTRNWLAPIDASLHTWKLHLEGSRHFAGPAPAVRLPRAGGYVPPGRER